MRTNYLNIFSNKFSYGNIDLNNNSHRENPVNLGGMLTSLPVPPDKIRELVPKKWYISPKEIEIQSIPTVIVDPHNEVFPFWLKVENGPALLLHIDKHPDDSSGAPIFNEIKNGPRWSKEQITKAVDYSKNILNEVNFICPAMHKEVIGCVYWYDPRLDELRTYGQLMKKSLSSEKSLNETSTRTDGTTHWGIGHQSYPDSIRRLLTDSKAEVGKSNRPIILDIDLDSFLYVRDIISNEDPNDLIFIRLEKVRKFLEGMGKKPALITIARSQTPYPCTPHNKVDEIQKLTIKMLN